MRFTGGAACVIVALDCIDKATGNDAQTIFSADHLWAWWVVAAFWGVSALLILIGFANPHT